jgi:soluble lytic murein transglycosylase
MLKLKRPVIITGLVALAIGWSPVAADTSRLLSASDHKIYSDAFAASDKGKRGRAASLAVKGIDPLPAKILRWLDMTRPGTHASFGEISGFLETNPDWPLRRRLFRRAEEALVGDEAPDRVVAWFAKHRPRTADGRARLGDALIMLGRREHGAAVLRHAWIESDFGAKQEQDFYRRFRKFLRRADHRDRLDRLVWDGRFTQARRMLWRVDPDTRQLAEARMRLAMKRGGVDGAIDRVPDRLKNDSGLIFERARWRRRKGRTEEALELLEPFPDPLVRPVRWWIEREILARRLLAEGRAERAYRLVKDHGLKRGARYADAEFLGGWIALRFLHDPARALEHFERLYASVRYPISQSRAAYWAGRAAVRLNDEGRARDWFEIAATFDASYYGQLAAERIGMPAPESLPRAPTPSGIEIAAFNQNELVRSVFLLNELGQDDLIKPFIDRLMRLADGPSELVLVGRLALAVGRLDLATRVGRYAYLRRIRLTSLAYPVVDAPEDSPEHALLLSIARQESNFDVDAISRRGARGIMQVMPRTARKVSKQLNLRYSRNRLQTDPTYNMRLGGAYLKEQIERFDGSYILAIAAYNAGPNAVDRWISRYGDPRSEDLDPIDWIEMIPYRETRNYVQRVIENLAIYRQLVGKTKLAYSLRAR